ncbi:MAG: glutamate synthase-related protein [Candidatus Poribacteria bacterium]
MPQKYHITPKPTLPRFTPIGKYGTIDWMEGCLGCLKCVKKHSCVYENYDKQTSFVQKMKSVEYLYLCKNCLRCVQECTKGLLQRVINPEYSWLGDSYWTPEMILSTWYQAETGKIPVSGGGYRGPFVGKGFDEIWTDMSEIVRPTRDGIHGREYISTAVDLGRKLTVLKFDSDNTLVSDAPPLVNIPIPLIFNILPFGDLSPTVLLSMAQAASEVGSFMIIKAEDYFDELNPYLKNLIPLLEVESIDEYKEIIKEVKIAEFIYTDKIMGYIQRAKQINSKLIVSIRLPMNKDAGSIVDELARSGAEIIHLYADYHGNELDGSNPPPAPPKRGAYPRFIKDVIRGVHLRLVEASIRDEVTIIASGGIALAEHLAKIIICGADLAAIDLPLLIALECRLCKNCLNNLPCPVEIHNVTPGYAVPRIANLIGAWHSQLIEVLGAMGLREVRRLRGEVGRAMFYEELEEETFGSVKRDGVMSDE